MAGTIEPIAALTAEDHGPINTIVSIVLPVTSILIATVRMAMRRQKFHEFEPDDIVFVVGLCFGVFTSILSHFCVRAGLGRHQETLDEKQVVRYFKLFWTTQISGVITLALAKLSLVVLFQRIAPKQMGPQTTTWLMPMVAVYTLLSLFLIAFQCQMPQPWILSPKSCSTHGNVYYPITISNMLTDAMLAIWIFPVIWGLQMKVHTKSVVLWLFGSRLLICVADIGRMVVIHKALQSEDQTRSQLIWAVMDQIVVHLSINHATLPRIQTFLSHLQIGGMSTHLGASRSGPRTMSKERSSAAKTSENHLNGNKVGRASDKAWDSLRNRLTGSLNRTPSISEQPLTQQQQGIELSTIVYSGKSEAEQRHVEQDRSAATSSEGLTREPSTDRLEGVRVQKDFQIVYNQM